MNLIEQITGILLEHGTDEHIILDRLTGALVEALDYAGALIVTREDGDKLLLRAFALGGTLGLHSGGAQVDPSLHDLLQGYLSQKHPPQDGKPLARLDHAADHAVWKPRLHDVVESDSLFELLYPLLDEQDAARRQTAAGVQRVIAVPFGLPEELCGSLLVLSTREAFSARELRLLQLAAQQTALGIRNARLFWRVEEQRRVAQTFAHMAFSASAYLHSLRNQIGGLRTYLGLVQMLPRMRPKQRAEVIATSARAHESLDQVAEILDHLHEPWRRQPDAPTRVNECLTAALLKVFPALAFRREPHEYITSRGLRIEWLLAPDLPPVQTSPEMLTEAFRIVIRNAVDSLHEKHGDERLAGGALRVGSQSSGPQQVTVTIRDNGVGIAPDDLRHIFELGWSTKKGEGMGFGLFWARNFVEGLGGKIEVESKLQEGAEFRFSLPAL